MYKRIGVFGGTFNPIHIGHLMFAEAAREQAGLSMVLFMPAHIQPFKLDEDVMPDEDRLHMLKLSIADNPCFEITTIEIEKGGVSYTIDSLRSLQKEFKDAKICFIIGADMFLNIGKWKEAGALLKEFDIIVGMRPGTSDAAINKAGEELKKTYGASIEFVENPRIELSSTEIREHLMRGESIRYHVPECVRRYLIVREKVGEKRFEHTKRVIDLAASMADQFGENREKAELAALLHDYSKDPQGGIENDIRHGEMAAEEVYNDFGIKDEDILNAIRYHTTGRAGMSRLERIIFLADTVEPGRTYNSIARLRETCLGDLEQGTYNVLVELKEYLLKKGLTVSADTEAAIAEMAEKEKK